MTEITKNKWIKENTGHIAQGTLRKKCPYSEIFWFVFSHIWTECGEIQSISSYSVRTWENTDQKTSEHRQFSRSGKHAITSLLLTYKISSVVCEFIYQGSERDRFIKIDFHF